VPLLTPTRELAAQILANIKEFIDLRSAVIFGGVIKTSSRSTKTRRRYFVATPGRLIDLQNYSLK
jgi:ATP-dependent RNA helicase RhlE